MVFIRSGSLIELPEPHERRRQEWTPVVGSVDRMLDAVARRDRRIADLNRPLEPEGPEQPDVAVDAVKPPKAASVLWPTASSSAASRSFRLFSGPRP
jgi:hypothetical protein